MKAYTINRSDARAWREPWEVSRARVDLIKKGLGGILGRVNSTRQGLFPMRILAAIPITTQPAAERRRMAGGMARSADAADARASALSACIASLHQLYGPAQHIIDHATRVARTANERTAGKIDIVVCTTGEDHLLGRLNLPVAAYRHHPTACAPPLLGFECHAALDERRSASTTIMPISKTT